MLVVKILDFDSSGGIGLSWLEDTLKNPLGVFLCQPFLEFIADEIFDLVDVDNDGIADEGELQTFSNLSLDTLCVLFVYECPFLGKYLLSFVDRYLTLNILVIWIDQIILNFIQRMFQ